MQLPQAALYALLSGGSAFAMRLWSLHPKYLDRQGLLAVWREGLLAQKVLKGETRGYRFHPQLLRFRRHPDPVAAIATYLEEICTEAARRGYSFSLQKIAPCRTTERISVTAGQRDFEWSHLVRKLAVRSRVDFVRWREVQVPEVHPLFIVVPGDLEEWEKGAL